MAGGIQQIGQRVPAEKTILDDMESRLRILLTQPGAVASDSLSGAFVDTSSATSTIGALQDSQALAARTRAAAEARRKGEDSNALLQSNVDKARNALDSAWESFRGYEKLVDAVK